MQGRIYRECVRIAWCLYKECIPRSLNDLSQIFINRAIERVAAGIQDSRLIHNAPSYRIIDHALRYVSFVHDIF